MEFKHIIRQLRKEKKLTQSQLEEELGMSSGSISHYENGRKMPEYDNLKKIANFFNVSIDYLLGNSQIQSKNEEILTMLDDDPELYDFWNQISKRDEMKLMFKQTRNLPPEAIKDVIKIIKIIEKEEGNI